MKLDMIVDQSNFDATHLDLYINTIAINLIQIIEVINDKINKMNDLYINMIAINSITQLVVY
jgi:histidine ammonia-lyase